jgi:hypothetical protein
LLNEYVGVSFGSFEANRAVAREIQHLLNRLYLRVECPKSGKLATIACMKAGATKHGAFVLRFRESGRTTSRSSSTKLPKLKLISAKGAAEPGDADSAA